MQSDAGRVAMGQMVEAKITRCQAHEALVEHQLDANGELADGVFEGSAQEHQIGSAETVVGVAGEQGGAVDVGAAERRIEVERHACSASVERRRIKKTKS